MSNADLSGIFLPETAYTEGEFVIDVVPLALYLFGYEGDVSIQCHRAGASYLEYPDNADGVFRGWVAMSGKVKIVVGAAGGIVQGGPVRKGV